MATTTLTGQGIPGEGVEEKIPPPSESNSTASSSELTQKKPTDDNTDKFAFHLSNERSSEFEKHTHSHSNTPSSARHRFTHRVQSAMDQEAARRLQTPRPEQTPGFDNNKEEGELDYEVSLCHNSNIISPSIYKLKLRNKVGLMGRADEQTLPLGEHEHSRLETSHKRTQGPTTTTRKQTRKSRKAINTSNKDSPNTICVEPKPSPHHPIHPPVPLSQSEINVGKTTDTGSMTPDTQSESEGEADPWLHSRADPGFYMQQMEEQGVCPGIKTQHPPTAPHPPLLLPSPYIKTTHQREAYHQSSDGMEGQTHPGILTQHPPAPVHNPTR